MQTNKTDGFPFRFGTRVVAALAFVGAVGCAATAMAQAASPDLTLGAAQFPEDDAIILRWEQHWTLDHDGTVHRRDHYWVKLLNSRPIRRFGDPRLAYVHDHDKLIFHTAQSTLPDGTILPVPDYSFNPVGPDRVAGWPEYKDWQEVVVSFSGIEAGVVLELDYEVVTPPGIFPWIDADIRLDDQYPVVERVVSVTVPGNVTVHHRVERAPGIKTDEKQAGVGGAKTSTYQWTAKRLPGDRGEPQDLPWRERSPRLRFTTCPDDVTWTSTIASRVDKAAKAGEAVKEFAESAVEEELDPSERVRKVAKKVHDSFNFVNSSRALRGLTCRAAKDVLHANYGNRLESAALVLAALRSLGMEATPMVGVNGRTWSESDKIAPIGSALSAVVVRVDLDEGPLYVHPQRGLFKNPGNWGRRWLLGTDAGGELQKTYVSARGEREPSDLRIAGKIAIDGEGKATGELRINLTGGFYDPADLETADAQKALVKNLVGRVLSDFDVESHSIVTLSDDLLKATANVTSTEALKKYDRHHMLKFGDGPAFLAEYPLPLERSQRKLDVYVGGRLREQVNLTIELPDEWKASIIPASLPPVEGKWGRALQTIELDGQTLRFRRTIEITADTIPPADFAGLRDAVNDLRTPQRLILAGGK